MAVSTGMVPPPSTGIRVSLAIADAFLCLSFAMLWLFFVAFSTMVSWGRTCSEECPEFHAWKLIAFLFGASSAQAIFIYMQARIRSDAEAQEPSEKELRPHTVLGDSAYLGIHVLWVFVLRVIAGDFILLKGSPTREIGSVILDVGVLGFALLYCFIVIPILALRTRKMSRIRHGLYQGKML